VILQPSSSQSSLDSKFESEYSELDPEENCVVFRGASSSSFRSYASSNEKTPVQSERGTSPPPKALASDFPEMYTDGSPSPSERSSGGRKSSSPRLSVIEASTPKLNFLSTDSRYGTWNSETLPVPTVTASTTLKKVRNRCICSVPYPLQPAMHSPKFAKLMFEARTFNSTVPKCRSAQDASSTAMVFCIMVDPIASAPTLVAQLRALVDVLQERRRKKRQYRPAWAVLLCHQHGGKDNLPDEMEPWSLEISEFEREHGALWRFGPCSCTNGEMLYSVFAKIASKRIYAAEHPDETSNNSPEQSESGESVEDESPGGPVWGAEQDESFLSHSSMGSFASHGSRVSRGRGSAFNEIVPSH